MPLIKSKSDKAFKANLKAEMAAGKSQKQALAIAYAEKRRSRAEGGQVSDDFIDPMTGISSKTNVMGGLKDAAMGVAHGIAEPFIHSKDTLEGKYQRQPEVSGQWSDADEGMQQIMDKQSQDKTIGAALNLATSGYGGAPLRPGPGLFGGKFATTADQVAMREAQAAERAGIPRRDIKEQHGWEKGPAGEWMHEIGDEAALIRHPSHWGEGALSQRGATLEQVIKHDKAFEAYPALKNMKVIADHNLKTVGQYSPWENTISFNPRLLKKGEEANDFLKTILHEMQHRIDDIEKFSKGPNLPEAYKLIQERLSKKGIDPEEKKILKKQAEQYFEQYWRAAQEVRARNVEDRIKMPAHERRGTLAMDTESIPRMFQLIKEGSGFKDGGVPTPKSDPRSFFSKIPKYHNDEDDVSVIPPSLLLGAKGIETTKKHGDADIEWQSNPKAWVDRHYPNYEGLAMRHNKGGAAMANGGVPWFVRQASHSNVVNSGLLHSPVAGRTDNLNVKVPNGSYIVPADIVSSMGEGNTLAGGKILERTFHSGPGFSKLGSIKSTRPPRMSSVKSMSLRMPKFADGGMPEGEDSHIPIMAAGGEFVIHPDAVRHIGGGDLKKGHSILDAFVKHSRKKAIKTMSKLPGPAKD